MDFLANFGPRYIQHHCEKCHSTIMTLVLNESCSNTNILGIYRCLKDFSMGDKSINPLVALYFLKILVTSTGVVKIPWEPFASLPGQILFWPRCPHTPSSSADNKCIKITFAFYGCFNFQFLDAIPFQKKLFIGHW